MPARPTPPCSSSAAPRDPAIDWLRTLGIMAVLLVHSGQVFSPWQYWHVQNAQRSVALGTLTVLAWPWLMPLFMFLAGMGTWRSLSHRTARQYLRERGYRLLIPLLFGTLLLVPPQVYVERLQHGQFRGSYFTFYPEFFHGVQPKGNFEAGHLWFLGYLYAYVLISLPLFAYERAHSLSRWLERIRIVLQKPAALLFIPALTIAVSQVALRGKFPQSLAFYNDFALHAQLLLCYLCGYAFASPAMQSLLEKQWRRALPAALATLGCFATLTLLWDGVIPRAYTTRYVVGWLVFGLATWSCIIVLVGAAGRYLRVPNRFIQYASSRVYAFYLLHQTIVAVLAYAIVQIIAPVFAKYILLIGSAAVATAGLVELARHWKSVRYLLGLQRFDREASLSATRPALSPAGPPPAAPKQ